MVDGVCSEERGKFEGKSEVPLPLENTEARGGSGGRGSGPGFQTEVADGSREADGFFEAEPGHLPEEAMEFDSALPPPSAPPPQEPLDSVPSPPQRSGARDRGGHGCE